MTKIRQFIEEGWAVMKDGSFWGILSEGGGTTTYGWGSIKTAMISFGRTAPGKPEDFTWKDSHHAKELRKGTIVRLRRTTTGQVYDGSG